MSFEIWIKIILDLLSLTEFHPLFGGVIILTQDADWIRLAEHVKIFELASRDKKIHFHRESVNICLWNCVNHLAQSNFFSIFI